MVCTKSKDLTFVPRNDGTNDHLLIYLDVPFASDPEVTLPVVILPVVHQFPTWLGPPNPVPCSAPDDNHSEEGLTTIYSGRHEYAFSFEIPQTPLATSFEGKHGSVRYWVKAELNRPWLLPMKTKKEFTVFEHIDINTPLLLSPQAGSKEKTLCCWFCTSGPILLSAKIERMGYTPGESIQIFAEIENCSSRMVVPKAAIYQTQTFYAKGKMKEIKQLVANIRGESLSSGKTETWNGKMLKIPPVSPSILDCSIIRVEYSLMVYVDIPGAMNLFINLPLVIGTIPLHPFGSRTSSVSSQCSMTMSWLGMTLPERPEAPPAYAEIVSEGQLQGCLEVSSGRENFDSPLFAYIQEFRFRPPPPYSVHLLILLAPLRENNLGSGKIQKDVGSHWQIASSPNRRFTDTKACLCRAPVDGAHPV
ncbi:Arrestin domain-containing protein 3 TBP-2-like inducible membrane protein [Triplophysa tibetana]|uniref:Arrestin domain-containing protein 3 n=1 Tax=Triplophysa tibetana TaxID=1572043 RepID=A0A5A9P245_9TELE|nr:Arrestin domain-containing protein 3 TBP-2-like inducible membrane protein [Triplophysa tibetana]